MLYYLTMALTIVASVFYQLIQKSIPEDTNPFSSLIITYITSIIICIAVVLLYPNGINLLSSLKKVHWTSYALGISIIGLEIGYLLAYRAGWKISFAAIFSNVAVTLLLIPIGLLFFGEKLSATNMVGILFCISGLILLNYK